MKPPGRVNSVAGPQMVPRHVRLDRVRRDLDGKDHWLADCEEDEDLQRGLPCLVVVRCDDEGEDDPPLVGDGDVAQRGVFRGGNGVHGARPQSCHEGKHYDGRPPYRKSPEELFHVRLSSFLARLFLRRPACISTVKGSTLLKRRSFWRAPPAPPRCVSSRPCRASAASQARSFYPLW